MGPFLLFRGFTVFSISNAETSLCFPDVVDFVVPACVFIYTTFVHWVSFALVARAENILQLLTGGDENVASSFIQSSFSLKVMPPRMNGIVAFGLCLIPSSDSALDLLELLELLELLVMFVL